MHVKKNHSGCNIENGLEKSKRWEGRETNYVATAR